MSKILVSMWVYETDRDLVKVRAAKEKKTMADVFHEAILKKKQLLATSNKSTV